MSRSHRSFTEADENRKRNVAYSNQEALIKALARSILSDELKVDTTNNNDNIIASDLDMVTSISGDDVWRKKQLETQNRKLNEENGGLRTKCARMEEEMRMVKASNEQLRGKFTTSENTLLKTSYELKRLQMRNNLIKKGSLRKGAKLTHSVFDTSRINLHPVRFMDQDDQVDEDDAKERSSSVDSCASKQQQPQLTMSDVAHSLEEFDERLRKYGSNSDLRNNSNTYNNRSSFYASSSAASSKTSEASTVPYFGLDR